MGFKDVLTMAIAQTIGSGVLTMTGVAIGLTGRGVVAAYLLSSLFIFFLCLPSMFLGSALPTTGGSYRYITMLLHPIGGLFYILVSPLSAVTISVFAISFADYAHSIIPSLPVRFCSILILSLGYLCNLLGLKQVIRFRNIMILMMAAGFAVFIGYGLFRVDFSQFTPSSMVPNGVSRLFTATGLLTFATGGSSVIINLGDEMKNPKRDIPLAMALSPLIVSVVYSLMAVVASGILPLETVSDANLTLVAAEIMPPFLYYTFILFGALFAIATALNSTFSVITKPALAACDDGWIPGSLGKVNIRFGTPHILLTIYYAIALIPLVFGFSLSFAAVLSSAIALFRALFLYAAAFNLRKRYPKEAASAPFRLPLFWQNALTALAAAIAVFQIVLLIGTLSSDAIIGIVCCIWAAFLLSLILYRIRIRNHQKTDAGL